MSSADEYLEWYIEGEDINGEKFTVKPHGSAHIVYANTLLVIKAKLKKPIPNARSVTVSLCIDGKSVTHYVTSAGEALKYQMDINDKEYNSMSFRFADFGINSGWHYIGLDLTYETGIGDYHYVGETLWDISFDVRPPPVPPTPSPAPNEPPNPHILKAYMTCYENVIHPEDVLVVKKGTSLKAVVEVKNEGGEGDVYIWIYDHKLDKVVKSKRAYMKAGEKKTYELEFTPELGDHEYSIRVGRKLGECTDHVGC